jgi:hypothetical protein
LSWVKIDDWQRHDWRRFQLIATALRRVNSLMTSGIESFMKNDSHIIVFQRWTEYQLDDEKQTKNSTTVLQIVQHSLLGTLNSLDGYEIFPHRHKSTFKSLATLPEWSSWFSRTAYDSLANRETRCKIWKKPDQNCIDSTFYKHFLAKIREISRQRTNDQISHTHQWRRVVFGPVWRMFIFGSCNKHGRQSCSVVGKMWLYLLKVGN